MLIPVVKIKVDDQDYQCQQSEHQFVSHGQNIAKVHRMISY